MLNIRLEEAGKKFGNQWIFRDLNLELFTDDKLAVTGHNGSGKSTFLQILSGFQALTKGSIVYRINGKDLPRDQWYRYISFASPYLDLPEELNLEELIGFYQSFKPFRQGMSKEDVIIMSGLDDSRKKPVKYYSSGMKQRVKLTLALSSEVPLILLDEPASNLDNKGIEWYRQMVTTLSENRITVVCSNNQEEEIFFCGRMIRIGQL